METTDNDVQQIKTSLDSFCQTLHGEVSETMDEGWKELLSKFEAMEEVESTITPYFDFSPDMIATTRIQDILEAQSVILQNLEERTWLTTCPHTKWIFEIAWSSRKKKRKSMSTKLEILLEHHHHCYSLYLNILINKVNI